MKEESDGWFETGLQSNRHMSSQGNKPNLLITMLRSPHDTIIIKLKKIRINREYFMESAGVRYLRTSYWRIRNRTSERSERVRFLIQKRVRKYRTKHFPCGIVFIIYIPRHSSFWRPFYFKSFKNAYLPLHTCRKMTKKTKYQLFSTNVC